MTEAALRVFIISLVMPAPTKPRRKRALWAWFFFLLTVGSAYVFFVLPRQLQREPMRIEFSNP